ncbi:MAG: hypothetical protein QOH50_3098 [Kribbellaceae bacterium]|nr:hypothetical protein [Kribbellaceae bacterium]
MLHNLVVRWAEPFPRTGGALSAWVRSYAGAEHLALGGDVTRVVRLPGPPVRLDPAVQLLLPHLSEVPRSTAY